MLNIEFQSVQIQLCVSKSKHYSEIRLLDRYYIKIQYKELLDANRDASSDQISQESFQTKTCLRLSVNQTMYFPQVIDV